MGRALSRGMVIHAMRSLPAGDRAERRPLMPTSCGDQ